MNDLLYALMTAVNAGEDIDALLPYDLSGLCPLEQKEVLSFYILYAKDEQRKIICMRKLEMVNDAAG